MNRRFVVTLRERDGEFRRVTRTADSEQAAVVSVLGGLVVKREIKYGGVSSTIYTRGTVTAAAREVAP